MCPGQNEIDGGRLCHLIDFVPLTHTLAATTTTAPLILGHSPGADVAARLTVTSG